MNHLVGPERQAMLRHLWRYGEYMEAWASIPKQQRPGIKMRRYRGYWFGLKQTNDGIIAHTSHVVPKSLRLEILDKISEFV